MINPVASLSTEEEAATAARGGALAALLCALMGVGGALLTIATADSHVTKLQRAAEVMQGPGAEAMRLSAQRMTPTLLRMGAVILVVFSLGFGGLGILQWRKLTRPIPLVLGLLTAYSLLNFVFKRVTGDPFIAAMHYPIWLQVLTVVSDLAMLALCYAGFRGASRLIKLRRSKDA